VKSEAQRNLTVSERPVSVKKS